MLSASENKHANKFIQFSMSNGWAFIAYSIAHHGTKVSNCTLWHKIWLHVAVNRENFVIIVVSGKRIPCVKSNGKQEFCDDENGRLKW